jgi:hypothetical protein
VLLNINSTRTISRAVFCDPQLTAIKINFLILIPIKHLILI